MAFFSHGQFINFFDSHDRDSDDMPTSANGKAVMLKFESLSALIIHINLLSVALNTSCFEIVLAIFTTFTIFSSPVFHLRKTMINAMQKKICPEPVKQVCLKC